MTVALWAAGALLIAAGVAGTVLPWLPGAPLVAGGLFLAAWAGGFSRVGWPSLLLILALTVMTVLVDLAAAGFGAQRARASSWAIVGAFIGTVLGIFFGLLGVFVLPFVGAVVGEALARRDLAQAGRAGFATWIGLLLGAALKLALVFSMIGVFIAGYVL